ncbi:MAG: hypothetical protein A2268_02605 [Candidatus Raymondbacteria bacterium RifOxyA12_full_50_37]|nr:MAG: hypothetical protein A2268_02605 [Candidatus Raymondbacteria bacterium RifOxyA12_full_50_37]OGJ89159.1 MAG: hypothetical protein A2248_11425 [Candidatus Raymondbacteria bacterium RIFOXYA2_FULL_49_16]OGJ96641.1 MAG: hypothetical protein A2453_06540 [Candidatus Raymondbacteria bacterium RIFOXYC2_FULL_50_21]OGP42201.1 MAG: hypothetical protein A2324_02265 [Candidatus Raymondbacteria bacterium RIFOXYB2_FULL_49_35]
MKRVVLLFIGSILFACHAAEISVRYDNGAEKKALVAERDGNVFFPATVIFDLFSNRFAWAPDKRKLVINISETDLIFTEDNPFVSVGGEVREWSAAPFCEEGDLYVPAREFVLLLDSLVPDTVTWDAEKKSLRIGSAVAVIDSFTCEERKNGTVFTLFLPGKMAFDHTFFKPQLNINVLKGKVSVEQLTRKETVGLVTGISAVQFAGSAQISLIISARSGQPEVCYKDGPCRIEAVLRNKIEDTKQVASAESAAVALPDSLAADQAALRIKRIIIDPGHGGEDPGAVNTQAKAEEKEIVLAIGLELRKLLKEHLRDVTVLMTRDDDTFVPLKGRSKFANSKKGDLFISVHANSISGNKTKKSVIDGFEVYFLDLARDDDARAVAALENSAIQYEKDGDARENIDDIDFMIKSIELNTYRNQSERFAICLEQEMSKSLKKVRRHKLGVNQANFYVLRGVEMPAVLIEAAFISNPEEVKVLRTREFHRQVAEAVLNGIVRYADTLE